MLLRGQRHRQHQISVSKIDEQNDRKCEREREREMTTDLIAGHRLAQPATTNTVYELLSKTNRF